MGADVGTAPALSPRERLGLPRETYWWLDLLEPGDPLWLNYPDGPDTPFRFLGFVNDEAEARAGQPAFHDPNPGFMGAPGGDRVAHPVFLLPVPPWCREMDVRPERADLLKVWEELGVAPGQSRTIAGALDEGAEWD